MSNTPATSSTPPNGESPKRGASGVEAPTSTNGAIPPAPPIEPSQPAITDLEMLTDQLVPDTEMTRLEFRDIYAVIELAYDNKRLTQAERIFLDAFSLTVQKAAQKVQQSQQS